MINNSSTYFLTPRYLQEYESVRADMGWGALPLADLSARPPATFVDTERDGEIHRPLTGYWLIARTAITARTAIITSCSRSAYFGRIANVCSQ